MEEVVESLQDVARELQNAVDELRGLNRRLDQVSDGLFYLNLHLGAEVSPWTGRMVAAGTMRGLVREYDRAEGGGYVEPHDGGPWVFVDHSVVPPPGYLSDGQEVIVDAVKGDYGPLAVRVRIA